MDYIRQKWNSLTLIQKIILGILSPILALLIIGYELFINVQSNPVKDEDLVDTKKELNTDEAIAKQEGKIEQLDADKNAILKGDKNEDPNDYFNSHNFDDNK